MSSSGREMATSNMPLTRSASPSELSISANFDHALQLDGKHSRYFLYSSRHLHSNPTCSVTNN